MNLGPEPIVNEVILIEKSSCGVCCLVSHWNCFGVWRKVVCKGSMVRLSIQMTFVGAVDVIVTRSSALVGNIFMQMHQSHFSVIF